MQNAIFSPWQMGNVILRNRLVRSATNMRMAGSGGEVTEDLIAVHRDLAAGGVGLDITGHTSVVPEGRSHQAQLGAHSDSLIDGMKRMVQAVHDQGGKILMQLGHGGRRSRPLEGKTKAYPTMTEANEMSLDQVERIIEAFVAAAERAEKAGFDGVQLHAAHGYLLSDFLSPVVNTREDPYGGREGGTLVLSEIISGIRSSVRTDFLVTTKLGADYDPGGNDKNDVVWILEQVVREGLDCVEISKGVASHDQIARDDIVTHRNEAYNLEVALDVKRRLSSLPVILVGGLRSVDTIEAILEQGIDDVALSRPLLAEPHLPSRWMDGDHSPAFCTSCSWCLKMDRAAVCPKR